MTAQEIYNYLEYLNNKADRHLQAELDRQLAAKDEEKAMLVQREMRNRGLMEGEG